MTDSTGQKLNGTNKYTLHFANGKLLPAPNDTIYLVMRLYWPKTDEFSILPAGEGTWQPPAVVVAD